MGSKNEKIHDFLIDKSRKFPFIKNEISKNGLLKITKQNNPVVKKVKYPNNYPSDEPRRRCPSIEEFCKEFKF